MRFANAESIQFYALLARRNLGLDSGICSFWDSIQNPRNWLLTSGAMDRLSEENPLWGTPRIQTELHLLGLEVAESTVAKYRIKSSKPSSQTWKTFLSNHTRGIIGIDFFTVPTATVRNLYCFIILLHERRQVVHFNVAKHPTSAWTAQQPSRC
jgi:hypothetical protein